MREGLGDALVNNFDYSAGLEKFDREGGVGADYAEEDVFDFDGLAAELAGFESAHEDGFSG